MKLLPWCWLVAGIVLTGVAPATAQDRPANEEIGSWTLSCAPNARSGRCQLRHRTWLVPPAPATGTPGAALEVMRRGGRLVPVVTLRGLSTQAAIGALALQADVGLRFDNAARMPLNCQGDGAAMVCTPRDAAAAAGELAAAHSVLVQLRLELPGGTSLPEQMRSLELEKTAEALARFQATAPTEPSEPAIPGLDWRGLLDRLTRDVDLGKWLGR